MEPIFHLSRVYYVLIRMSNVVQIVNPSPDSVFLLQKGHENKFQNEGGVDMDMAEKA